MERTFAQVLAPYDRIAFIGICKNAGKTTALCHLLDAWQARRLAITSVGQDGERCDLVTGTPKPEIPVTAGTLLATARGTLPQCQIMFEVLEESGISTPLGEVVLIRALTQGTVRIAGPSMVEQLPPIMERFRFYGAQHTLIDGAAARLSPARAAKAVVLCIGASFSADPIAVVAEAAHLCRCFSFPRTQQILPDSGWSSEENALAIENGLPRWEGGGRLLAGGAVTSTVLRHLLAASPPECIVIRDATRWQADRFLTERYLQQGGSVFVTQPLRLAAVTANPFSARGTDFDAPYFLDLLRQTIPLPIFDVREAAK